MLEWILLDQSEYFEQNLPSPDALHGATTVAASEEVAGQIVPHRLEPEIDFEFEITNHLGTTEIKTIVRKLDDLI
jgi:hypothetical protein